MSYMSIWHFCAKVLKFRKRNGTVYDGTVRSAKYDRMGQSSPWKGYGYEGVLKEISGSICAISTLYMGYWRGFMYDNPSFKLLRIVYLAVRSLYLADFKECTTATEKGMHYSNWNYYCTYSWLRSFSPVDFSGSHSFLLRGSSRECDFRVPASLQGVKAREGAK